MQEYMIQYEAFVRLVFFILFAVLFTYLEQKYDWRVILHKKQRWMDHISLAAVSTLLIRMIFPLMLVNLAAQMKGSNQSSLLFQPEIMNLPVWTHYLMALIALDFMMYWQHRVMHRVGLLWRLHLMHHTDSVMDASTGVRFHPFEYLFSMGFKMLAIILIGPPAMAVLLFEIILNAASMFTHSNILIPQKWDLRLRNIIVTPGMHRVHHSDIPQERNSNFGFFLSCWDRMFRTYRAFSMMSERKVVLGVEEFRAEKYRTMTGWLMLPFYRKSKRKRRPGPPKLIRRPSDS